MEWQCGPFGGCDSDDGVGLVRVLLWWKQRDGNEGEVDDIGEEIRRLQAELDEQVRLVG